MLAPAPPPKNALSKGIRKALLPYLLLATAVLILLALLGADGAVSRIFVPAAFIIVAGGAGVGGGGGGLGDLNIDPHIYRISPIVFLFNTLLFCSANFCFKCFTTLA